MTLNRMISAFRAAATELGEGLFVGAQRFVTLRGEHPAVQLIVGSIKQFVVIKGNDKNSHGSFVPHPFMEYRPT